MKKLLQNHPGYTNIPTNSLRVIHDAFMTQHQRTQKLMTPLRILSHLLFLIAGILGVGIFSLLIYVLFDSTLIKFTLSTFLVLILLLLPGIIYLLLLRSLCKKPKYEQMRYYEVTKVKPLSLAQREALRLDVVMTFTHKWWAETLEFLPIKERVAQDSYQYCVLPLSSYEEHRESVFDDWGIVDQQGYEEAISSLWRGMHAFSFALNIAQIPEDKRANHEMLRKLAVLLEITPQEILKNAESQSGQPPTLLWGFDLRRAIYLSRVCFCAGMITEEDAWRDLNITSNYIHALFDNFESYYQNYCLGHAYWLFKYEAIKDRKHEYKNFKKSCGWEIKDLPWRKQSLDQLPPYMLDGFKETITPAINKQELSESEDVISRTMNKDHCTIH